MKNEIKLTAGQIATLVCQLEVAAAKPGNVHRAADFEDATLIDFLNSGVALGHVIDSKDAYVQPFGETILSAVNATRWITDTNTNLGIILLLCPLAELYRQGKPLEMREIGKLLESLTAEDSKSVFEAIAISEAGGLNPAEEKPKDSENAKIHFDVNAAAGAPDDLLEAMGLASEWDLIAQQYSNSFSDVLHYVLPMIEEGLIRFNLLSSAIIYAHVSTMAEFPDTLIARKLGRETAIQSASYAQRAIDAFEKSESDDQPFWDAVGDLDFWLRSDHHHRNPGTTADLVTAALFVGVATGRLLPPFR